MYGEAGTVKEGKRRKVLDRGVTMMFVGYSQENPANCFKMFYPTTSRLTHTRDIIWLGRMYHKKTDAKLTQQSPIVSVPVMMYTVEDTKADGIDVEIITDGIHISKERGDVTVNVLLQRMERKDGLYTGPDMDEPLGGKESTIQRLVRQ